MNQPVFTAGMRTPFCRAFKGACAELRPDDMMVELIGGNTRRFPALHATPFDDLVVGCAYPEGEQGYNVARMIALGSGLDCPGLTVNRLCASSLEAAAIAAARIKSGWGKKYLIGGVESMSRIPRRGANWSESDRIKTGCEMAYVPNGVTAENVATRYAHLTRQRQEDLAAASHERAGGAFDAGKYAGQIFPLEVEQGVEQRVERDELIRLPVNREKMASLKPAFDEAGSVTAATSSPLTDGATCGVVIDKDLAREAGIQMAVEIVDVSAGHVPPEMMGMGPVPATRVLLERNKLAAVDIAAYEINEAFAIQVLASMEELAIPADRVNTWGGAMAIGHPLGASGLRLLMTLHDRLVTEHQPGEYGVATLCVGGGQGMSMLVRSIQL